MNVPDFAPTKGLSESFDLLTGPGRIDDHE